MAESQKMLLSDEELLKNSTVHKKNIGQKSIGLLAIPSSWRPPFNVLLSNLYDEWLNSVTDTKKRQVLRNAAKQVLNVVPDWRSDWPRGIILRSSATVETMNDRGAFISEQLAASSSEDMIIGALSNIFVNFQEADVDGSLAIIVQPLVAKGDLGHCSNERRVSKTVNQWQWSLEESPESLKRYNSQRATPPPHVQSLNARNAELLISQLRSVSNWCVELNRGPAHLEWSWDRKDLWLLQIDFEDETPDAGIYPNELKRSTDKRPASKVPDNSHISKLNINGTKIGWKKADTVRQFAAVRAEKYPDLFILCGDKIEIALQDKTKLENDLKIITHDRAVCRTDCTSPKINRLNLPRTDSMCAQDTISFIEETHKNLIAKGAKKNEICFIIHKFIPAISAAWALAYPTKREVIVDSIWGVPDGLQYYPHDSFEVDIPTEKVVSERLRYKPCFIQELENGEWKRVQVKRSSARGRSLPRKDVIEIAKQTYEMAQNRKEPISVMWFCDIPEEVGIGRNLPWFSMPPEAKRPDKAAPLKKPYLIRDISDIERAELEVNDHILVLEPEVQLIRENDNFLDRVIKLAKEKAVPVQMQGSSLCHAFYILQRADIPVFPADMPKYKRVREKQSFNKLVRDKIPEKIHNSGEQVLEAKIHKNDTRAALLVKLLEEAFELKEARTPKEVTEELADVLEVVKSIAEATGVNWSDVENAAVEKREERGSFKDNVVLLETYLPKSEETKNLSYTVSLSTLAKAIRKKDGTEVSFPALLQDGKNFKFTLSDGKDVELSMSSSGLLITEKSDDDDDTQLTLL